MREKWFSLSVADIEKKLKTNAALGLNHKAARSRFSAKNGFLFETEEKSVLSLLPKLLSDFAVIIILVMSVVALFFGETATGGVSLVFTLALLGVALVFYYRDERYFASAKRAMSPRCKVIRQGKLYSLAPRHVVVGDIILIGEGDVVPADARLITSDALKVRMLVEKNKYILLEKLAEGAVSANENDPTRFINIVHAGSVVVSGAARAVVTAVGRYTYAGAKIGNIAPTESDKKNTSELLIKLRKTLSLISISLLTASLPISLFSMLLGGDKLSLFSVFMSCLSVAFLCSAELSTTFLKIFYEIPAKRLVMAKDSAVVKNSYALDALSDVKYLFLLDGGSLTDGVLHLDGVCVGEGEFDSYNELPASAKKLSELAFLYLDSKKAALSVGSERYARFDDGIREFVELAEVDKNAIKIRCSTGGYAEGSAAFPCDKVMFTELGEKYVLSVSLAENIIDECASVFYEDGTVPASEAFRYSAHEIFERNKENGKRTLIFCVAKNEGYGAEGEKTFVGMIALSEKTGGSAEQAKKEIEARGIKVVSFKDIAVGGALGVSKIPDSILGKVRADVKDFTAASKPLSHRLGEIDCYENFTPAAIEELISHIHARGERVAVIGVSDKFDRIYRAADVIFTVSLDKYAADPLENVVKVKIDPNEIRTEAGAQSVRQIADAVIPRYGYADKKGGLLSVVNALKSASMAANNLLGFVKYLLLAQTVRFITVLLPMLFGVLTADARHLLLVGVVSDVLALFAFAYDGKTASGAYSGALSAVTLPVRSNKREVLIFGAAAAFSVLLPTFVSFIPGVPAYIDRIEYSFVSLALFHAVLILSLRLKNRAKREKFTFIAPLVILLILGLSFVGVFADILDIEGFSNIIYFFLSLACPVLSGAVYLIFSGKMPRKIRMEKENCK